MTLLARRWWSVAMVSAWTGRERAILAEAEYSGLVLGGGVAAKPG